MLLTGLPISASEALRAGLISHLALTKEELEQEVTKACEAVCSKSRPIVALGKKFYYHQLELGISGALDQGGQTMVKNIQVSLCVRTVLHVNWKQ